MQDKRKLRNHYLKNGSFKYDLLALLPLDLLYAVYGVQHTILRLPRILKFGDFQEFFRRLGERVFALASCFCLCLFSLSLDII